MKNRTVRAVQATKATSMPIHLLMNDTEKKGQCTSWGSGAFSVIHSVGLTPSWMCKAIAAPNLDLNETKAAGTSFEDESVDRTGGCIRYYPHISLNLKNIISICSCPKKKLHPL